MAAEMSACNCRPQTEQGTVNLIWKQWIQFDGSRRHVLNQAVASYRINITAFHHISLLN